MRVILLHNPSAGHGDHSSDELADQLRNAGHDVVACVRKARQLGDALDERCDVVAAAGGDGTVGKALRATRGTGVPVAALPYGTANNLARALGCASIDEWPRAAVRSFDLARLRVDGQPCRFAEAFGAGAFARVIHQLDDAPTPAQREARLARDLVYLLSRIDASPLKRYAIDADGDDRSGDYFLVQVVNIPAIGARVPLVPGARFDDGTLELVVAGREHRAPLVAALERLLRGEPAAIELPTWPVRRVRLAGDLRRYHRDGNLRNERTRRVEIAVEPAAARVLAAPPVA